MTTAQQKAFADWYDRHTHCGYPECCGPIPTRKEEARRVWQAAQEDMARRLMSDDVIYAAVDARNSKKHRREKDKVIATLKAAIQTVIDEENA